MKKERSFGEFDNILEDIKDVKIQGANAIALAGVKAALLKNDSVSLKKIISTRPTEPLLQNFIKILENSEEPRETARELKEYLENAREEISRAGAELIHNNMNVFSHCHSSTVMDIFKYAKHKQKKDFVVYTLEVEPLLQGRITAKELANEGIKVVVFPDLAAEEALKKCDLFLFGADAFLKNGVVNKIGTSEVCNIAKRDKIRRYSCGVSLKYTKSVKIENRSSREVWDAKNENIVVVNPAFDFTKKSLLTGVVSELGILPYHEFIKKAKKFV